MDDRKIENMLQNLANEPLPDDIAALAEQKSKEFSREISKQKQSVWRVIMKSKITKLAAAAVILIAVIIGVSHFGGSFDMATPAFADVIRPLLAAETGSFEMTINVVDSGLDWINCGDEPVQTVKITFAGPSRTRWDVPTGEVLVANMQHGKVMILVPSKKQAIVMQVSPPGMIPLHNRFNKLLELRQLIQYAVEAEDDSVEFIGRQKINGVTVIGYHMTGPYSHGDIIVWADAKTKLPVQIEQTVGTETAIVSNIACDIELEGSLFSVEPPEGYSIGTPGEEPTFIVRGTVTDASTGEPIAGAKVTDDGYGSKPYRGTITDSEGRYSYLTWSEEHGIKAEAPGYKPQRKGVGGLFHAEAKNEKIIDFTLERE